MEKILADLKKTMNSAMKKSGELVEITKAKMAVADTKSETQRAFTRLGELVYTAAQSDAEESGEIQEVMESISALKEKLHQQEKKLADLTNKKICAVCGKACNDAAAFCDACGSAF